ncbi:hypothetical protein DFP94_1217 [Fontibacillus phaseoli]|uniref:Uncharacterized protein n=1 Tax=Fontibacillus phaseoli TaxID=1416533 RepID=A0A369AW32_9BACL|nr:hypothetical protein [Fontibacillus phaseoli]RCX13283.1 hypothetical protein DFP94_1217 [Fontibacillus phaseoli]
MNVALILMTAALVVWLELPRMLREREQRELWGFSVLLLLGVGISLTQTFISDIPTPLILVASLLKPFSDFLTAIGLIQ